MGYLAEGSCLLILLGWTMKNSGDCIEFSKEQKRSG